MNTDHVVVKGNDLWCKACGQREPLQLPLSVKDFSHFCQTWAQAHALCLEAAQSKLVTSMREAIATWPKLAHIDGCAGSRHCKDGCSKCATRSDCVCTAGKSNVARAEARKLAGLEDKP